MYRNFSVLIGVGASALALALPAGAAAQSVAAPGAPTAVREYAGTIVFSQFDAASASWSLAVRRVGAAQAERLPVASSPTPFEADIGPDSRGRPAVIYQRCAGTRQVPTGCDLFVFSLDGASGERAVRNANDPHNDDVQPTLWRGRIAWTREYSSNPNESNPIVYTKTLTAPRSRPSTRLPGVPRRRCGDFSRVCGPTTGRRVEALELWGKNLAMTVAYGCDGCSGIDQRELRLVDVADRAARQVAFQVVGLGGQSLIGPSFVAGQLGWYKACLGDGAGCKQGRSGPFRYRLATRRYVKATGPIRVDGFADSGSRLYEVTGCSFASEGPFDAGCRIDAVPAPAYAPVRAPLR
jgi:hypothetical protein